MGRLPSGRGRSQGEHHGDGGSHGEHCGDGVRAELETTLKNESENEQENGHFHKRDGMVRFSKNYHFSSHFFIIFKFSFENEIGNELENKLKMA